jgi:hypothetical protein
MPRYRFKFFENGGIPELEMDLPDNNAARQEAVRTATQMMSDASYNFDDPTHWRVEVYDEADALLYTVRLDEELNKDL